MNALRMGLSVCILVACRVDGHYEFPERHALTVQVGGSGVGSVSSEPAGLTCSAGTCTGEFFEGTVVRLSASATTGSFLGWTEACRGQDECTVTMDRGQALGALFGAPGEALWARQLGSEQYDSGKGIALDTSSNLIVAGIFSETITLGSELTSDGVFDIYIAKLASFTGNVIWAKRFGGTSNEEVLDIAVDGSNNVYVLGTFFGSVDFGGGPMTATGGTSNIFVLKLDAEGNFLWARKIEAYLYDGGAIATNGDAVVVTVPFGSITVDTTTLMSVGHSDILILKMSASTSETIWSRSFGGTSFDHATDIKLDSDGNVVLTGSFSGILGGSGGLATPNELTRNGLLMKLADASGMLLLSKQLGSSIYAQGSAVAVDSENNIVLFGSFQAIADLGCSNRPSASQPNVSDLFLVRYTQAGSCMWTRSFGGMATTSFARNARSVALNSHGEIFLAGDFSDEISFGGETLVSASAGDEDVFAARFASDGTHLNSVRSGGSQHDRGFGIVGSADGRMFVTGNFLSFAEFGGRAFNSVGIQDAFIVGFAPR